MPNSPSGSAGPKHKQVAKWGAACAPCAAAKAKCLRTNESLGSKCDRCQRLFKDCSSQIHRPRKKRTAKPSKTSQLEDRLNGLVDLLRASGELPNIPRAGDLGDPRSFDAATAEEMLGCIPSKADVRTSHQPKRRPRHSQQGTLDSDDEDDSSDDDGDGLSTTSSDRPFSIPASYNSYAPASCICRPRPGEAPPPPESDEALLSRFRAQMTPCFPFVPIFESETPATLASTRPFLWQTIKMAASVHSVRSMRAQLYRIMQHISDYVLMRCKRNLDLLQGIIVVLGWYHYHCMMHAQINSLVHMAEAMLADLGLNRHPRLTERTRLMVMYPDEPVARTNEDRRALLGVWFLSSSGCLTPLTQPYHCLTEWLTPHSQPQFKRTDIDRISLGFQKTLPMRYTPYVQTCLRELEAEPEFDTDPLLVNMVRVQHLTERISQLNTREDPSEEMPGMPKAPTSAYQSAFHAELEKIRGGLSKSLRRNWVLMAAIQSAELHLFEPPIIDATLINKFSRALTVITPGQPSVMDVLYRANGSLRSWFKYWFSIPVSEYHWFPMAMCSQLIYAVCMLSRWAKLVGPIKPNAGTTATILGTDHYSPQAAHLSMTNSPGAPIGSPPGALNTPSPSNTSIGTAPLERPSSIAHLAPPPPSRASSVTNTATPSAHPSPAASSPRQQDTDADYASHIAAFPFINLLKLRDPEALAAVAALKAQLLAQPDLGLDIPEILSAVGSRLDQAWRQSNEMAAAACAARGGDPATELVFESNVWDLSARKFLITRAKLERWAEIVAGGGVVNPNANAGTAEKDAGTAFGPESTLSPSGEESTLPAMTPHLRNLPHHPRHQHQQHQPPQQQHMQHQQQQQHDHYKIDPRLASSTMSPHSIHPHPQQHHLLHNPSSSSSSSGQQQINPSSNIFASLASGLDGCGGTGSENLAHPVPAIDNALGPGGVGVNSTMATMMENVIMADAWGELVDDTCMGIADWPGAAGWGGVGAADFLDPAVVGTGGGAGGGGFYGGGGSGGSYEF